MTTSEFNRGIEKIVHNEKIMAIIFRTSDIDYETDFITPKNFPFQAKVQYKIAKGNIPLHEHLPFPKLENLDSQEILYIIKGKIKIGLYEQKEKIAEKILENGDMIILNSAHDVEYLKKTKLILIKQGPHRDEEKRYLT